MENKSLSLIKKVTKSSNLLFKKIHESREIGLKTSREIIGISSRSIRAAHRGEYKESQKLIDEGIKKLKSVKPKIIKHSSDMNSTFLLDGEKELCEAIFFISFTKDFADILLIWVSPAEKISNTIKKHTFTGDGSTVTYNFTDLPSKIEGVEIYVNNILKNTNKHKQ